MDKMIVDMFNETAERDDPLDGIMGNGEYDEFERGKILELFNMLDLDTDGRILDAGCGIGRNISVLKAAGFTDIICVDFSEKMLDKCREKHPDITAIKSDLANLSQYPDDYFETAFLMYVFIHIVDDDALRVVISELERVTRGSVIVGQVMDAENKPQHRICRVREVFEMHPLWGKKRMDHFYKNWYEFHGRNHDWTNRVSFVVYK